MELGEVKTGKIISNCETGRVKEGVFNRFKDAKF